MSWVPKVGDTVRRTSNYEVKCVPPGTIGEVLSLEWHGTIKLGFSDQRLDCRVAWREPTNEEMGYDEEEILVMKKLEPAPPNAWEDDLELV